MFCPECNKKMMKAGLQWSGRHKVQRYRCGNCGRVTTAPSKSKRALIDNSVHDTNQRGNLDGK